MSGQITAALDASALSTFREGFAGEIVLPEDTSYDAARIVWNGMIDRRPAVVVRSWGRAIARVDADATAFPTRDAAFWASAEAMWDEPGSDQEHREWVRSGMGAITPFAVAAATSMTWPESGEDVVRSVYGDAKYERLVQLKRGWDPDNVFRLNQNIRP